MQQPTGSENTGDGPFRRHLLPGLSRGAVARCQVAGIGKDGTIRYHVGIAFTEHIPLNVEPETPPFADGAQPSPSEPPQVSVAPQPVVSEAVRAPGSPPVAAPRNRW